MPHVTPWTVQHPGLLVFLLDQSGAMADRFGADSIAPGTTIMEQIASVVNLWIRRFGQACIRGPEIRPRADLSIVGYGGRGVVNAGPQCLDGHDVLSISELFANPIRHEEKLELLYDSETGEVIERRFEFPIWVEPVATGDTPMCTALDKAIALSTAWAESHRGSYPPIIINITDGAATDGDPRRAAHLLTAIETHDGQALLYNCHISHYPIPQEKILYPVGADEVLREGALASMFFSMSSEIPRISRNRAEDRGFDGVRCGSRGFVYNGDVSDIIKIIDISTAGVAETSEA